MQQWGWSSRKWYTTWTCRGSPNWSANRNTSRRIWNNEKRTAIMAIIAQYKLHGLAPLPSIPTQTEEKVKELRTNKFWVLPLPCLAAADWNFCWLKVKGTGLNTGLKKFPVDDPLGEHRTFGRFITWETAMNSTSIDPLALKNNYVDYILFPWYMYWVDPSQSPVRHLIQTLLTNTAKLYFPAYFGFYPAPQTILNSNNKLITLWNLLQELMWIKLFVVNFYLTCGISIISDLNWVQYYRRSFQLFFAFKSILFTVLQYLMIFLCVITHIIKAGATHSLMFYWPPQWKNLVFTVWTSVAVIWSTELRVEKKPELKCYYYY